MSNTRSFPDVTSAVLTRVKELGLAKYGVVFDPPDGLSGTATSRTPLGQCVIEFVLDGARSELTLTLVKKPWLLPEGMLWNGFVETLARCQET
jgi:hypothetical protein